MALEVPIVASDIAPVREALGDTSLAGIVPPEDVAGLAAAVTKAIQDPAASQQRTTQARERFIAQYDVARVAGRILAFYETALGQPVVTNRK